MTASPGAGRLPLRQLGRTTLQVTPLCVGCAPLGDMPDTFDYSVSDEQALDTLRTVFQGPINFLDTAAAYGDGTSERRIGLALRELHGLPEGYVVATKADRDLHTGDFSGDQMRRSIERSLRLLGLDRLQLVHLHDPEHSSWEVIWSPGGAMEVLQELKQEGVIGYLGIAGGPVDLMLRYVETGAFDSLITHNRYTLLNRSADTLIEAAHARNVAVLNAAPYGSGILAKGPDEYPRYAYQQAPEEFVERVRRLDATCRRYGVPLAAAALQFSLRDPRITSTVVGMTRAERVQQTVQLAQHEIPDELWAELAKAPYSRDDPEANRWS
ncbi:MAG: aldo/keto reductase [Chloroflexota bacterium]|nr:aldo/keto reductase [Chloroflexota bacterium]